MGVDFSAIISAAKITATAMERFATAVDRLACAIEQHNEIEKARIGLEHKLIPDWSNDVHE